MKARLIRIDTKVRNEKFDRNVQQGLARKAMEFNNRAKAIIRRVKRERRRPTTVEVDEVVKLVESGQRFAYHVEEYVPADMGTVINHWDAYKLVRMGCAVPHDVACARAANMSDDQCEAAQRAYEKASLGIHPDDYEAYEAGLMNGYDEFGHPTKDGVPVKITTSYEDEGDEE